MILFRLNALKLHILFYFIVAAGLARLLSFPFYPLMDTTEARYAEIARIMVETGDLVTPWFDYGVPFWGKPPLSFWITAASFKLFGINEFAARFPHWLAGLLVVWIVWGMPALRDHKEKLFVSALLVGAALFYVSAGMVMTDMALVLGTTLIMRGFWGALFGDPSISRRESCLIFVGLTIGLLAKGPIAVVLSAAPLGLWVLFTGHIKLTWQRIPWVWGLVFSMLLTMPWYVLAEVRTPGFINYFIVGEHFQRFITPGWKGDLYGKAHQNPYGTIWLYYLANVLPWTVLLPVIAWESRKDSRKDSSRSAPADRQDKLFFWYFLLWGIMPAVFFTFAGNIVWAYVLPGIPALAIICGRWLAGLSMENKIRHYLQGGLVFTSLLAWGFIISVPLSNRDDERSAKPLVQRYQAMQVVGEPLIYFGVRPFSAAFYTQGKAQEIKEERELQARLANPSSFFLAVETGKAKRFPKEWLDQLEPVAVHGFYSLYKKK